MCFNTLEADLIHQDTRLASYAGRPSQDSERYSLVKESWDRKKVDFGPKEQEMEEPFLE